MDAYNNNSQKEIVKNLNFVMTKNCGKIKHYWRKNMYKISILMFLFVNTEGPTKFSKKEHFLYCTFGFINLNFSTFGNFGVCL